MDKDLFNWMAIAIQKAFWNPEPIHDPAIRITQRVAWYLLVFYFGLLVGESVWTIRFVTTCTTGIHQDAVVTE